MKTSKFFVFGVVILALLSLSFTACDENNPDVQEGNTYLSVTFRMPGSKGPAKAPAALPDDYNKIGTWGGKDNITQIDVYVVDGSEIQHVKYEVADDGSKDYKRTYDAVSGEWSLEPVANKAEIRTTVGPKKVYVVINGDVNPALMTSLNGATASNFEETYKTTAYKPAGVTTAPVSTSGDKLAVKNGVTDERIVMTNVAEVTINVAPNVTKAQTMDAVSPKNRASVNVQRVVGRVMITTAQNSYTLMSGAATLGVLTDITWALAQGENSLYVQQKANYETPNFGFVPANRATYEAEAGDKYDYSGLFESTPIPTMADYSTPLTNVTAELATTLSGKFILPNTHTATADETSKYKKGNTAYVLVRAKFAPNASSYADGGTYTAGADFYLGANGKFYTSAANATTPANGGVTGQGVARYVGGKVLYYAWVNPNAVPLWFSSPVIRNNIYHIHITGFKGIGTNWNPLYPENPDAATPQNPDPKPSVPGIPEIENPVDPTHPLTTPETWMSVDVTILPWTLHSYSVELGL